MFLQKLVTQLAFPLSASLLLLVLGLLLLVFRRRVLAGSLLLVAVAWLYVWSTPAMSGWLRYRLESQYPAMALDAVPEAQAIVVLGGAIGGAYPPVQPELNLTNQSDRVLHAARLYLAGKAPLIIVTGGNQPWTGEAENESQAIARFLMQLGVPEEAIRTEGRSLTTYENAVYTRELAAGEGIDRILLVTSALHMPRAAPVFRRLGFDVVAAATDHEINPTNPPTLLDWVPDADALSHASRAIKEVLGYQVYDWRGWLQEQ